MLWGSERGVQALHRVIDVWKALPRGGTGERMMPVVVWGQQEVEV